MITSTNWRLYQRNDIGKLAIPWQLLRRTGEWRFHRQTDDRQTGDSIGEHWGLPESKIILISIVLLFLLFILWVGDFGNTKKLPKNNVSQ